MTNTKPRKNNFVSSLKKKRKRPNGGEILDGTKFVRQRSVSPLLIEHFRKEIKLDRRVGMSGIGDIVEPTFTAASANSFPEIFEWEGIQAMKLRVRKTGEGK